MAEPSGAYGPRSSRLGSSASTSDGPSRATAMVRSACGSRWASADGCAFARGASAVRSPRHPTGSGLRWPFRLSAGSSIVSIVQTESCTSPHEFVRPADAKQLRSADEAPTICAWMRAQLRTLPALRRDGYSTPGAMRCMSSAAKGEAAITKQKPKDRLFRNRNLGDILIQYIAQANC